MRPWYASIADDILRESRSPAPKEQPPRESLRHTDRRKQALWKAGRRSSPKGKAAEAVNLSGSETDGAHMQRAS